ncbi:hypothetical protein MSG28_011602 [Choristoneura fumiferana]|uniref:Uncharacterized protein n=1 Tax=Choristoneura fumiferana TaxID=7141 RepID=A0ACC0JP06_CHOFU|nr:hypothetical protein MSG28_011602 [Choristoneura fumiferana]
MPCASSSLKSLMELSVSLALLLAAPLEPPAGAPPTPPPPTPIYLFIRRKEYNGGVRVNQDAQSARYECGNMCSDVNIVK